MTKNKKNIKLVIMWVMLGLVAVVGLTTAFLLNYNTYSPSAPRILDDGKNIYISTTLNDNYVGYRFKFTSRDKEIFVDSTDNVIGADEFLAEGGQLGKTYDISVCYLAQNAGNNSQFSEKTSWLCEGYLAPTTVTYNQQANKIYWNQIEDADFYRVYYNDANDDVFLETTEFELNLQSFEGGEKIMYVVACSQNQHLKSSTKSNMVEFDLQHYFAEFSDVSFDDRTKILTAKNEENLEKLIVSLDGISFASIKFEVEEVEGGYLYKVDLTAIYNNETLIGIKPANIDNYNIFVGSEATFEVV